MTRTSFRLNRTLVAFAASALMAGSAVPAFAAGNNSSSNSNGNSSQAQAASAEATPQSSRASRGAGNRRICVVGDFTGSRLQQRVCKTEREWEAAGGIPMAE